MTEVTTPGGRRSAPLDRRHIERRQLTARRLLPAVERLLEDETYPELTVDQLVEEAGISRSTFYNYFEDKADLLRALTENVMGTIVDATRVWWMLLPNASKAELEASMAHLFEIYSPHGVLMRAVSESIAAEPQVREAFMDYMRRGTEGVVDYIRRGQEAGVLRPEIDAARAGEWLTWGFERGLSRLTIEQAQNDPGRIVAALADVLWRSLH